MARNNLTTAVTALLFFLFTLTQVHAYIVLDSDYQHYPDTDLQYRQAVHYSLPENTHVIFDGRSNYEPQRQDDCQLEIRDEKEFFYAQHGIYTKKMLSQAFLPRPYNKCNVIVDPHTKPYYHKTLFLVNGETYPKPFIPYYTEPVIDQHGKVLQGFQPLVTPPYTAPVPLVEKPTRKKHGYVQAPYQQPIYKTTHTTPRYNTYHTTGSHYRYGNPYGRPLSIYRNNHYYPVYRGYYQ